MPTTETQNHTSVYHQQFAVPYDYRVWFTEKLFAADNLALRDELCRLEPAKRHRCIVFIDDGLVAAQPDLSENITRYCQTHAEQIDLVAAPIPVPGGEKVKLNLHFVETMQKIVSDYHIDRHSYVIGIGGGAVLDAVGLVAATAHRGIRHIRIPTTVLAQNDSGVGVKNGVNLYGQKNYIGSFAPPFAVLNDIEFVLNLPRRDQIAGMAEAVKVALIRDHDFYIWLEQHADALALCQREALATMIRRCAELHMKQIAHGGDPFESGSARPLDFGHWAAHRMESLTNHHIRHGEAVAIGIALDARYSVMTGLLPSGTEDRICFLLEHLGFQLWHSSLEKKTAQGRNEVLQGLADFREHLGGQLTITLLQEIGVGIEVHEMDEQAILAAIQWLKGRQSQ
jgi:3-dehydroquinate synthase